MFYRLENNKVAESFDTEPDFHPDLMATVIESSIPPQDDEIWETGTGWVAEFTEAELLVRAQGVKTSEIKTHAKSLVDTAYSNPTQSASGVDVETQRERMLLRRNAKADKLQGALVLTTAEKDEAKTDQKLSEFELKIQADSDKAVENMLKLTASAEVVAFDVGAENWNAWTPPV